MRDEGKSEEKIAEVLKMVEDAVGNKGRFTATMLIGNAVAVLPSHAPSLSVHETAFGTVTKGDHQESIQELSVRIVSHADPGAG